MKRREREDDLERELRDHLELEAEEQMEEGATPKQARLAARRAFGNIAIAKENVRAVWGWTLLEQFAADVRYGVRTMRRSPGFTAAAVLTLALGIGATTAVFSVVNAVVLRQLQFPEAGRIMTVLSSRNGGIAYLPMEYAYCEWKNRSASFDILAGALTSRRNAHVAGGWRDVAVAMVSFDFFHLIGARPVLGRFFSREDDQDGAATVAVLDYSFWRQALRGDAGILGQAIVIDQKPLTVIGVLAPGVRFPGSGRRDVWTPLKARLRAGCGGRGGILAVGRLRPGVTRDAAQAELNALKEPISREMSCMKDDSAVVTPLRDHLVGGVRGIFLTLFGAAGFLLLLVCANIANLLLARGTARTREMATRAAIGAGRWRLAAQSLAESLLLAAAGGLLGLGVATAAVKLVPAVKAVDIPRVDEIAVDWTFLLIGAGLSVGSVVLFGLAPAFQAWRRDLVAGLHGSEVPVGPFRGQAFRLTLVAAQMALAMVLLSGAGLMTNTLLRLLNVDLGFKPSSVLEIDLELPQMPPVTKPDSSELVSNWRAVLEQRKLRRVEFLREAAERVRGIPGVESVSISNQAPFENSASDYKLSYDGTAGHRELSPQGRDVDPGYFKTAGIPLLVGRDIEPADASRRPLPIVLNRSAARELFGSDEPLGKVVSCTYPRLAMQVIGVAGDARLLGVTERPKPQVFVPLMGGWGYASLVVVRTAAAPSAITPTIRSVVRSLDPGLPPPKITALEDLLSDQIAKPRFYAMLLNSFAGIGLILAAVGIYGVTAYSVARRTHEFGVRLALGATPRDILRLALTSGVWVIAAGVLVGTACALALTRLLSSILFDVRPRDPVTFISTAVVLSAVALLASWLAARRSPAVNPTEALRCE